MNYFFDTNILVYVFSDREPVKHSKASDVFLSTRRICSTQVLSELSNVLSSKFHYSWPSIDMVFFDILSAVDIVTVTVPTMKRAQALSERYKYSYYDSLILASAIEANCSVLYSEDFQNGQEIEGVRIINPFL